RSVEPLDETEQDDRRRPDDRDADRDSVEVPLSDTGGADRGADPSAAHVGKATALPLLHEYGQDEEDSGDDQQHLAVDAEGVHEPQAPFGVWRGAGVPRPDKDK